MPQPADPHLRSGPGRPRVPTERIVDAALRIVDERGAGELSMRALAADIHSSTATIYRHFSSRTVLLGAVIDRVLGEVDVDQASYRPLAWRGAAQLFAEDFFAALARHPNVARLMADQTPVGPNAAALRETWLGLMLGHGFPVAVAARSGAMISHLVLGFAIQLGGERADQTRDRNMLRESVYRLDLRDFPATAAVAQVRWRPTTIAEEFAFALELVLDGLAHQREG